MRYRAYEAAIYVNGLIAPFA
ncbi:hypothetical protein SPHINGO361_130161 [Sphingomonas sp. EC-HK361]|nr:hypothetical protein SPHINGO361_130161 [Sphingomonas sp. EC-HK361]